MLAKGWGPDMTQILPVAYVLLVSASISVGAPVGGLLNVATSPPSDRRRRDRRECVGLQGESIDS